MKPEEALEILRKPELPDLSKGHIHTIGEPKRISMSEYMEARKMAIKALEKQIPKKPRYYIDNWGHNRPGCPGCARNEILYAGQKYCSVCGTKIDWSDPKHD